MENSAARKIFDSTLSEVESLFNECLNLFEVATLLATKYGLEYPEWAAPLATASKKRAESAAVTKREAPRPASESESTGPKPHPDFPLSASLEEQVLWVLAKRGGKGGTKDIYEDYVRLAGNAAEKSHRQVRYAIEQGLLQQGRVVKEEPGPSFVNNYWRLPDASPLETDEDNGSPVILSDEDEVTASNLNRTVGSNPKRERLPKGFKGKVTLSLIKEEERFIHEDEAIRRINSEIDSRWPGQPHLHVKARDLKRPIKKLLGENKITKVAYGDSPEYVFYGLPQFVSKMLGSYMYTDKRHTPRQDLLPKWHATPKFSKEEMES